MKVRLIRINKDAIIPEYMTPGAAGADVCIQVPGMGWSIAPGQIKALGTGFAVEIPKGYECQIRSRSGMASLGLIVANAPGTIDSDYRGEVQVLLTNITNNTIQLFNNMRVAQLVLARVSQIEWEEESEVTSTKRGTGGFGSTK